MKGKADRFIPGTKCACLFTDPRIPTLYFHTGDDLKPADANGLCDPYVVCKLAGKKDKTRTVKKNRYPGYYETLCFDDVMIPEGNNFEYATQLTFRLYDYDIDGDDYLGECVV